MKKSFKRPKFKGYDCPDCKRNVASLYSVVVGRENGKLLFKYVCWTCSEADWVD